MKSPSQLSPSKGMNVGQKHYLSPPPNTPETRLGPRSLFKESPATPALRVSFSIRHVAEKRPGTINTARKLFVDDFATESPPPPPPPPPPATQTAPPPPPAPALTEEERSYCDRGFSQPEAKYILECLANPKIAQQIPNARIVISPLEIASFRRAGLKGYQMLICKNWELSAAEYREFHEHKIYLSHKTKPRGRYPGSTTPFGQGQLNSVYAIGEHRFKDGPPAPALGKKMPTNIQGWVSTEIGIPKEKPLYLCRNIATYWMSKLFWPVIPRTETVFIDGSLSIAMEKAPGTSPIREADYVLTGREPELRFYREKVQEYCRKELKSMETLLSELETKEAERSKLASALGVRSAEKRGREILMHGVRIAIRDIPFNHPALHLELQKLQILDAIMGQGDRHGGNYFIYVAPATGAISVMGIDNDQCAGYRTTDPAMLAYGIDRGKKGFRGADLPIYIHEEIAQRIRTVTNQEITEMARGLIFDEEVDAIKQRIGMIRVHCQKPGVVVPAGRWPEKVCEMLANPEIHKNHSYAIRDANLCHDFQAQGRPTKPYSEVAAPK